MTTRAKIKVKVAIALLIPSLAVAISGPVASAVGRAATQHAPVRGRSRLSAADNDLLDDISRRAFRYFWEQTNLQTGLVLDRARTNGMPDDDPEHRGVASIAATGFGLTALSIAGDHRWISPRVARERVRTTLRFLAYRAPQEHGWFYHFMDASTGERRMNSEVSSIDTALLLAGVLTARQAFHEDGEIVRLATTIYNRVDFPWMLNGSRTILSHGWTPETGFLPYRWDTYSEHMILYVLAIGSPTHPISPDSWYSWMLPVVDFGGHTYISGGPLFTQQYSLAWVDLRLRGTPQPPPEKGFVPQVDYLANAIVATRAERAWSIDRARNFPGYSEKVWGITPSDSTKGYQAWGGPGGGASIDGTVVPSAAGGSLMLAPDICIPALRTMLVRYGKKVYGRFGFADAFNPTTGWVSDYAIGINTGIMLVSAENLRTARVWEWFMSNPEAERSLDLVGFLPDLSFAPQRPSFIQLEPAKRDPASGTSHYDPNSGDFPGDDSEIPASSFEFKIPIPEYSKY